LARSIAKDHDEKRAAILKTAARFFADNGYDRSSMSDLAKACGISKALIYHYYASKDALLFDIIHSHLSRLLRAAETRCDPAETEPRARLRALVQAILSVYKDADAEHKVQLGTAASLSRQDQETLAQLQRRLVHIVSEALRAVVPDLFASDPKLLRPVTMSLFGMLNWFYLWYRRGGGLSREEYADLATDLILNGIEGLACTKVHPTER
jgi:AcrR family transcriptional regulator